ncbi:MAG: amino acid ABC transporter permease, partial [Pseudonocardiaceae bacterium]
MALTKRRRVKIFRGVQYAVLVLIVLTIALTADWGKIQSAFFNLDVTREMFPEVITVALKNTVIYTALGFGFGLALWLVLALMRLSDVG